MAQSESAELKLQFSHEQSRGLQRLKQRTYNDFVGPLRIERVLPSKVGNFGWEGTVTLEYDPIVGPIQEYLERRIDEEAPRSD